MTNFEAEWKRAETIINQSEDVGSAKKILNELCLRFPDEFKPYYNLALIDGGDGNYSSAIHYMECAVKIIPCYEAYRYLFYFYIQTKDFSKALNMCKMALIYNPKDEKLRSFMQANNANMFLNEDICITEEGKSNESSMIEYKKVYDACEIIRELPNFIEEDFSVSQLEMFNIAVESYKKSYVKEGFVAEMKDAMALVKQSEQTYFISAENKLLTDILDSGASSLKLEDSPEIASPYDRVLVLSSAYGGNFYHWLTWTVPRLKMIKDAGYWFGNFDKIIINFMGFKFQKDLVSLLNIPMTKVIGTLPEGIVFKAKKIVTASLPEFLVTPRIVTDSLREFFLNEKMYDDGSPKRIYLSRKKSASRFVLNEAEVLEFLKPLGFVEICAEDYSFSEQVKLFANADVVISQHGAGLVNTSFCKEGAKVVEIYNEKMKNKIDTSYWKISSNVGLKHYFMFGDALSDGQFSANMNIDIEKLRKLLVLAEIM